MRDDRSPEERLDAVAGICREFRIDSLGPQLSAAYGTLRSGGVVDIAVLGRFKAGKSSFLNSLIGKEILPVDVLPATAVVTRIGHGEADGAVVRRAEDGDERIAVDRIAEFVTERHNPGNGKKVTMVEVTLSFLAEYPGVRFVDTPGIGSVFADNTAASLGWIPRAGGALLAVSASHPFSGEDRELLEEALRHTPEAAILLTKADLVGEGQLETIVGFTGRQAALLAGRDIPVLPYSILPDRSILRDRVREYLLRGIVEERRERFDRIVDYKVRELTENCRSFLRLAQAAASATGKARAELREILGKERAGLGEVRREIRLIARDVKSRVRSSADERFHSRRAEVAGRIAGALPGTMAEWRGNLEETVREYRSWLARTLEEELTRLSPACGEPLSGFALHARESVERTVRAFQDRLAKEIDRALGVSFEGAKFDVGMKKPVRPDVRTDRTFDTGVELLWFLVPMRIFRPLVRRHFLRRIPWEVEKNLSRLAAQWADAAGASVDDLARRGISFLEDELAAVEALVQSAPDRGAAVRKALDLLDSLAGGKGRR